MTVTMELTEKEVAFLQKLMDDMGKYEKVPGIEDAIRECIKMAMFEESEPMAADEGVYAACPPYRAEPYST